MKVAYRAADDLNSVLAEIFNQAMILHLSERPRPALERYRAAEALARDLGERSELVRALTNDASLLVGPLKDPRSALAPIEEAARLLQPDDPPGLLDAVAGPGRSIRRQVKAK